MSREPAFVLTDLSVSWYDRRGRLRTGMRAVFAEQDQRNGERRVDCPISNLVMTHFFTRG